MTPRIDIDQAKLAEFCRKWHIKRLWLFGSVLRDDFRDDSDVDVLYEFEEGETPGLKFVKTVEEAEELFGGRKVDLISMKWLSQRIKDHFSFKPQLVYDEG